MKNNPLYLEIADELKERIRTGNYSENELFITEKQITNEYGVSRITATRTLNELEAENLITRKRGSGSYVTKDAKNILNAIFSSCENARKAALVLARSPQENDIAECINGINEVLNPKGRFLYTYCSNGSIVKEAELLKDLANKNFEGVICLPNSSRENLEIYSYYKMIGKPLIFIELYSEILPINAVVSDNRKGSRELCDSLFDKGHTKIGYFSHVSLSDKSSLKDRYFGYIDSLKKHGQIVNLDYIEINIRERCAYEGLPKNRETPYNRKEIEYEIYMLYLKKKLKKLLSLGVTAIMGENDALAMDLASVCDIIGVNFPDMLDITGFNNTSNLSSSQHGKYISTAEQDFKEIGQRCGRMFLNEVLFPGQVANIDIVPVKVKLQ